MDLRLNREDDEFRAELLDWLDNVQIPAGLRDYGLTPTAQDLGPAKAWQRLLWEGGWSCLAWPVEHGGRAATAVQQAIFAEELARRGLPRLLSIVGPDLAGPLIISEGTPAQREAFLPGIRTGTQLWCQLFSEPGAGSDLAGITTRAVQDGAGWRVTGQKVWTSAGHIAEVGLLMARTEAHKYKGISFFLLPMDRSGIEIRPLVQMDGESKFNEVFLEDVYVGPGDLLGSPGDGWRIAVSMLGRERLTLGANAIGYRRALDELRAAARENGVADDPVFRQRWAQLWSRVFLLRATWILALSSGADPTGPRMALLKVLSTEIQRDLALLPEDVFGSALVAGDAAAAWANRLLAAPGARLAGGTSEVQRNIISERVLGLPRGT